MFLDLHKCRLKSHLKILEFVKSHARRSFHHHPVPSARNSSLQGYTVHSARPSVCMILSTRLPCRRPLDLFRAVWLFIASLCHFIRPNYCHFLMLTFFVNSLFLLSFFFLIICLLFCPRNKCYSFAHLRCNGRNCLVHF